jgi:diguanylate cyclase (GGDEF)-like protein
VPVTISIGVAEYQVTESLKDVFARADKALYRAKAGGRNQVVVSY